MKNIDIDYLVEKMADMSGLPIRIYRDGRLNRTYSILPLRYDPLKPYETSVLDIPGTISYYTTPELDSYGIISSGAVQIVVGPSVEHARSEQELRRTAFELNVPVGDVPGFLSAMRAINVFPLNVMLQMLCTLNYVVNDEMKNPGDFDVSFSSAGSIQDYSKSLDSDVLKTSGIERELLDIVRRGDLDGLDKWVRKVPSYRSGNLAANTLRQMKNTFIVTAALASRAAIEAGMDTIDSMKTCDGYILKCENLSRPSDINKLMLQMIRRYTECVSDLLAFTGSGRFQRDVYSYILRNLSRNVTTAELADALCISRSYLSSQFKKETGINLNEYVDRIKINEARKLLSDNSRSISVIGNYLGYSSSSHFTRTFKEITGLTPMQFRKLNGRCPDPL